MEIMITPSVAIIIPKTPSKLSSSFNMIYSKIAIWITSVLLNDVPTTKFENLKRYNSVTVNVTCKIDPKKVKKMKLVWSKTSEITLKSLKRKNNINANGKAKANLTYAEATNDKSLFNFFCNEVLRFWKKAAKIVKMTQFINLFRYNLLIELSDYLYLKN